ncbi:uncharacterized protein ACRADG_003459 isoform 1-T2 [Cochliomyia hominivorax]
MSTRLKSRRRPGDPWVSKNRVLNGGSGKSKRSCPIYRNPNFDTDETKLLIQLWGDPKVQRELITTHKKHVVISQLSAKMEEYGYYRTPEEITTRIKNMKCFYNRLKKEMETNKGMDPSWRHYAEMDAIMTRPIFSVRPNEVPAPSLKYLLEQEQEKRKERKRQAEEEGSAVSESDEDIDDILAVPPTNINSKESTKNSSDTNNENSPEKELQKQTNSKQTNSKTKEINKGKRRKSRNDDKETNKMDETISEAEMAIKMEIESEQFQEYQSIDENEENRKEVNEKKTEETIKTINISEDEELLVPKMEPIDVDEEYENKEKLSSTSETEPKQNFNKLTDMLKLPTTSSTNVTTTTTPSTATMIKFTVPANSALATSISSATQTQSKISVVSPTVLMPPQISNNTTIVTSSAAGSDQQRQVRLPGNLHALLTAPGSRTTVTNANGMKFLLVNAGDQRTAPITTSNISSALPITNTVTNTSTMKIIQQNAALKQPPKLTSLHQSQQIQNMQQKLQSQSQTSTATSQKQQQSPLKSRENAKQAKQEYREIMKKRDLLGIKTTLLKMLKVQEDANEIESERLAIERERLQFEKTIADRFLIFMEQNQKIQQQLQQQQQLLIQQQQQQQQTQHIQLQQRSTASPQVFATNSGQATVTPNGQIMLPPKLLITTMVPTSAAQGTNTTGATSKILTTTGFTNLTTSTATSSPDLQLVVPKEEPKN